MRLLSIALSATLSLATNGYSQIGDDVIKHNIDSINQHIWDNKQQDPTSALEQSLEMLEKSNQQAYKKGQLFAYKNVTVIHIMKGNYDSAMHFCNIYLDLSQELGDRIEIANAQNTLGSIYYHLGDLESATKYYITALKVVEEEGDLARAAKLYNNISNIYMVQENYDKALEYNTKSLDIKKQLGDTIGMGHTFNNVGFVNREIGNYEIALGYYSRALKIFTDANNKLMMANVYANIGETYLAKEELDSALKTFFKVIDLSYQHDGKRERIYGYLGTGKVYAAKSDFKAALPYLQYGNQLALQIHAKQEILTSYEDLAEAYAKQNDFKKAYESHLKYTSFKDSVINEANNRAIDELAQKYESEQKTNTIRVLELENQLQQNLFQRQRAVGVFLVAVLVIMVLLAHSLFKNNRAKKLAIQQLEEQNVEIHLKNNEIRRQQEKIAQHNEELDSKNKMLVDINQEKNHFIGIVVHDLRTPLNNIIGLVSLINMEEPELSPTQKELLDTILYSTKSLNNMIAKILNIQAIESGDVKMDMKPCGLNELVHKVVHDLDKEAKQKMISVHTDLEEEKDMAMVDENYTEQIFTNLLSNAIKFSQSKTNVNITSYINEDYVGVIFKDEGPGFQKEDMQKLFGKFQKLSARPTGGETSSGLGLSIVKKYVDAMSGKIWCESEPGEGAAFIVAFPLA